MPKQVILLALSLLAAIPVFATRPALAGGATTVRIIPDAQAVAPGPVSVEVHVENVTNIQGLAAYEFGIDFDYRVLHFASAADSGFLSTTGRNEVCLPASFDRDGDTDRDRGYVRVGCVTYGSDPPGPTGDGLLTTLAFEAQCGGVSNLTFERSTLGDPLGASIMSTQVGGLINVSGEPCPQYDPGDAGCDGTVNAIDAALILQFGAGLIDTLSCEDAADVNGDMEIDSLDAALVLQFVAGMIDEL